MPLKMPQNLHLKLPAKYWMYQQIQEDSPFICCREWFQWCGQTPTWRRSRAQLSKICKWLDSTSFGCSPWQPRSGTTTPWWRSKYKHGRWMGKDSIAPSQEPKHGKTTQGRPTGTYIDTLLRDTGLHDVNELEKCMGDRDVWRQFSSRRRQDADRK